MTTRSSQIHRPLVQLSTLNLIIYEVFLGVEMIAWRTFWSAAYFRGARDFTSPETRWLHAAPLDLWGSAFMISGLCLIFIFTDGPWKIGLFGAVLGAVSLFGLALSFLQTSHSTMVQAAHPGLFASTTSFFIALQFLEIVIATVLEHRKTSRL